MSNQSPAQYLITKIFKSLDVQDLDACETSLSELKRLAKAQPSYHDWCAYFDGVLANERDHDLAEAERIFRGLLSHQNRLDKNLCIRVLRALGNTYEYQGRWQEAIDAQIHSKTIIEQANHLDEQGKAIEQVKSLKNMAIAFQRGATEGDFDVNALQQSVDCCDQALEILIPFEPLSLEGLWLKGSVLNTLGLTYLYMGQWDSAIEYFNQDLEICVQLDDEFGAALSYGNLAEAYQRRGQSSWSLAEETYYRALTAIHRFDKPYEETDILTNLGTLYQDMGRPQQAIQTYSQAIHLIETIRASISAEEARTGFFTTVVKTYGQTISAYIDLACPTQAFDIAERARSRSFIEILANQSIRPPSGIPAHLVDQEQVLRQTLRALYVRAGSGVEDTARITGYEEQLTDIYRQIRLLNPEYTDIRTVHPLTHDQVQAHLPATTALLAYFTTGEQILAFVVTQDTLTAHRLTLSPGDFQRLTDNKGYIPRLLPRQGKLFSAHRFLEPLYTELVTPLVEELRDITTLCIIPHGILHNVPFHALIDGTGHALLDDYQIFYAPSVTVLLEYCQPAESQAVQPGVAFGYNSDDLHHAEAEAAAIAELIDGTALTDETATRIIVMAQAQRQRWVHFSCHGHFNPHAPLTSHLMLADGPLFASDILRELRLDADLVTLSACETGRNQILKGDELIGLVRTLLYAGTPSVVVSLWPVYEVSTRILMENFYEGLLRGQGKAEALRSAQLALRTMSDNDIESMLIAYNAPDPASTISDLRTFKADGCIFDHPYFWAPFILVGDRVG